MHACLVTQTCPALCDLMDCGPPGSCIHGVFQARILEWVAITFSEDLPHPGIEPMFPVSPALQVDSLPAEILGKPPRIQFRVGKGQGTELAINGPAEQLIY